MAFVIGPECIDVMDKSCLEECPVDCIYEGGRKLYINPVECIDCGACESVCPMDAIALEGSAGNDLQRQFAEDNSRFFTEPLPGREEPLGTPGGSSVVGAVGVDTDLVTGYQVSG